MTRIATLLAAGISVLAFSAAANAADLIISEPAAPGYVDVSGNWDGAYVGVFAGGAWGDLTDDFDGEDTSGWLVGAAVGADFTIGTGVVAGIVADIAWSDLTNDDFEDVTLDWTGSLRGRLGFDGGVFLPYLTAGLAVGGSHYEPTDDDALNVGWTAGAGVEFAVAESVSLDLQYRYTDLGAEDLDGSDVGFQHSAVTLGVNWRF